jgi:8-oxo-dGTP pyrophosphatase MutT (NUDIX family)
VTFNGTESVRLKGPPLRPERVVRPKGSRVDRVRCVIGNGQQFLLVRANARRPENKAKWSLPGGRLKAREHDRTALRRELFEELGFRAPRLIELGDWQHDDEHQRVFGCHVDSIAPRLRSNEILASAWIDYADVKQLARDRLLRWGFELAAITMFRRALRDAEAAVSV